MATVDLVPGESQVRLFLPPVRGQDGSFIMGGIIVGLFVGVSIERKPTLMIVRDKHGIEWWFATQDVADMQLIG